MKDILTEDVDSLEARVRLLEGQVVSQQAQIDRVRLAIEAVSYNVPAKLVEPMLRVADGTSWNPGSGAGIYLYLGGVWTKL